jgi:20S proteasome alpha/beta subunit
MLSYANWSSDKRIFSFISNLDFVFPFCVRAMMKSILQYNGGCVVAMAGKECIAIASDRRLGVQLVRILIEVSEVCIV